MESLGPQQNNILSGARLAHFERFLHEAPPRWRLRGEKFFFYEAFFERESQEKSNEIRWFWSQILHTLTPDRSCHHVSRI
jgi:hypothetical protein